MQLEMTLALLSAGVALASVGVGLWGQARTTRLSAELETLRLSEQRRIENERTAARYRNPLARAAYDLQSRFYNLLQLNFLGYLTTGDARDRAYVVDNTVFLVAQYFAWTEIVRRDIQYIDLGRDEATRQLARLQDDIYALFQTDRLGRLFRLFAGEQRAIGERMIREGPRGLECLGYAAYLDLTTQGGDPLIESLREDVRAMDADGNAAHARLAALQHALVELVTFLDPDAVRFARERLTKVPLAG